MLVNFHIPKLSLPNLLKANRVQRESYRRFKQLFRQHPVWLRFVWILCFTTLVSAGCMPKPEREVVVYTALDQEFSKPILEQFEADTGISVRAKYDWESNKTVGLTTEILSHQDNQRADLFWNNEILHTLRLKKAGLLEVYTSPLAADYPPAFVSKDQDWYGFAARARVLIVNTDLVPKEKRPSSFRDLANPVWKGKCGMARPFFGTTATHAAVLYSKMGQEPAQQLFAEIAANAQIEGGNKQVAIKVARGELAFGITDTDDAIIEIEKGAPVEMVFPDQAQGGIGTLLIPNTLCIIKNGPNTENAKQLIDYLLNPDVESLLAQGASAQMPLNSKVTMRSRVAPEVELKIMEVDFQAAADHWDQTKHSLLKIYQ